MEFALDQKSEIHVIDWLEIGVEDGKICYFYVLGEGKWTGMVDWDGGLEKERKEERKKETETETAADTS